MSKKRLLSNLLYEMLFNGTWKVQKYFYSRDLETGEEISRVDQVVNYLLMGNICLRI